MSPLVLSLPSRMLRKLVHRHGLWAGGPNPDDTGLDDAGRPPLKVLPGSSHMQVCPPAMWPSSVTLWGRASRWLLKDHPWTPEAARSAHRLNQAKAEFLASLEGMAGPGVTALAQQIDRARSLRELWHLRSTLYGLLALARTQSEAERRLATLNRHFPTRAPRAGVLPLEA